MNEVVDTQEPVDPVEAAFVCMQGELALLRCDQGHDRGAGRASVSGLLRHVHSNCRGSQIDGQGGVRHGAQPGRAAHAAGHGVPDRCRFEARSKIRSRRTRPGDRHADSHSGHAT